MIDTVIQVENLSKRYRIGEYTASYGSLRESLVEGLQGFLNRGSVHEEEQTVWALKDVSFAVKQGEVVGIIGRNGAGKSTLLKVLSRITKPTCGRAVVRGRVGSLLEVGTGFHPELTGRENIYLNGAILGMKRIEIERKFEEIVGFAEIDKFLDTPVKRYSSGMYVRLAFAVAAHLEPEILLVDEVLAVGDASFQKKCLGKMNDVARTGKTVIFVSHNMAAINKLCQRAIWLAEGSLQKDGTTVHVTNQYLKETTLNPTTYEVVWRNKLSAPGNEKMYLERIYVSPISGESRKPIYSDDEIEIGVEFCSLLPNQDLGITLHVIVDDIILLSTSSLHNPSLLGNNLDPGHYRAYCLIPANLLNEGSYRIKVLAVENETRVILQVDEAVSFEVNKSLVRRNAYYGKVPGLINPIFDWRMNKISSSTLEH
jgi:lipopolysaccharide transport system ATP-binding protein